MSGPPETEDKPDPKDTDTETAEGQTEPSEDGAHDEQGAQDSVDPTHQTRDEEAGREPDFEDEDPGLIDAEVGSDTDQSREDDSAAALSAALAAAPLVSSGAAPTEPDEPAVAQSSAPAEPDHSEEAEPAGGRSLAARVLTWLVLLIAGGGLALWGAPRVAENLPRGFGPVKTWLLPGETQSQQRIAALEQDLSARIDALQPGIDADAAQAAVDAGVADLETRLSDRIEALSDQVAAADGASIEARLAQLETQLEGLAAQIDGLAGLSVEGVDGEQVSGFAATVEGLRAELNNLAEEQGAQSQRIDDVEVAVQRRIAAAEDEVATVTAEAEVAKSSALALAALSNIEAALNSGETYDAALAQFRANSDTEPPAGLADQAAAGVASLGSLRAGFADAAHDALRAEIRSQTDAGLGGRLAAFVEAQVATRSLTPQEGNTADAILSRAEDALRRDNLAGAVDELAALSPVAQEAMQHWLDTARARVAAVTGYREIAAVTGAGN
ncbi:MAG: hypothetical protein AAGE76_08880 [Pseudomonadota bacterium]